MKHFPDSRGMKFENVSILTDGIKDIIKDMRYCWVDTKGLICSQRGVFRVNCVDCLDRTNVVQTAVARIVMETQVGCHISHITNSGDRKSYQSSEISLGKLYKTKICMYI